MNAAAPEHQTSARRESMNELWQINGTALTRFALRLTLGDKHRAEDIIQETLVRAWRHPEIIDGRAEEIRSWLFTICLRVSIDLWRAQLRRNNNNSHNNPPQAPATAH